LGWPVVIPNRQETLRFRNVQTQCVDGDWLFSKRTYRIHIATP
jgi:hypothetical protein